MKIHNADIDFDILEFTDRLDIIRSTAGCSLKGKIEFDARIKKLASILQNNPDATIEQLYLENKEFAHHCDRCLNLNGIDPDWVNAGILTALLFVNERSPGLLVQLNRRQMADGRWQKGGEKEAKYSDLLAGIYAHTQDLEQAMRLAEERPWKEVMEVLTKRTTRVPGETPGTASFSEGRSPLKSNGRSMNDKARLALMNVRNKTK